MSMSSCKDTGAKSTVLNFVYPTLEMVINKSVFKLEIKDSKTKGDCLTPNFPISIIRYFGNLLNLVKDVKYIDSNFQL